MVAQLNGRETADDHMQWALWQIDRGDAWRNSQSSRAAIILSANALVLAGVVVMTSLAESKVIALLSASIILIMVSMSAMRAMQVVANPGLKSMKPRAIQSAFSPLYDARQTLDMYGGFEEFEVAFLGASKGDHIKYALAAVWQNVQIGNYRYSRLKSANKWLFYAIISMLPAMIITILIG